MTSLLSLIVSLALLAGVVAFASHGANSVSFVELSAAVPPHGSATMPA